MRKPVELIYKAEFSTKSEASKEEYRIKKLTKKQKQELVNNNYLETTTFSFKNS
jgi:predicted GIY-YIG superfamily endonuclease